MQPSSSENQSGSKLRTLDQDYAHLVLGGARSGKSSFAEAQAIELAHQTELPLVYIATATANDEEMQARISRHQQDRIDSWALIEEPFNLADTLATLNQPSMILIDCLTLWLSNCLHSNKVSWSEQKQAFTAELQQSQHNIIMVSNEVGHGIIPMGELTRNYVDEIGWLHQELAQLCNRVTMVIAGLPQRLK